MPDRLPDGSAFSQAAANGKIFKHLAAWSETPKILWPCPAANAILSSTCTPAGHIPNKVVHNGLDCSGFRRSFPLLRN